MGDKKCLFWDSGDILWIFVSVNTHQILYFKYVQFIICKLCFNKMLKVEKTSNAFIYNRKEQM